MQDAYTLRPPGSLDAKRASTRARSRSSVLARQLLLVDALAGLIGAVVALLLIDGPSPAGFFFVVAVGTLWPLWAFSFGLYRGDSLSAWVSSVPEVPRGFVTVLAVSWPLVGVAFLLDLDHPALLTLTALVAMAPCAALARTVVRSNLHRASDLRQRTLILGSGVVASHIVKKLRDNQQFGLDPVGLIDDVFHDVGTEQVPRLGGFDELEATIAGQGIDRVIIAFSRVEHEQLLTAIRVCRDTGVAIDVVPRLFELLDGAPALGQVGGLPLLSVGDSKLTRSSLVAKRALDIVVSAFALVVLMPMLLTIAIAIKLDSRGPALFRQRRAGWRDASFELLKFRSMYVDSEERKRDVSALNDVSDGVMFKIRDDPRVTRVGRFIRRFSLDELPQLINVLKGDMSLVGPRPLIFDEAAALEEDWHRRRLELRPGITGPWQVYGRSQSPFQEMVRFDYQYVAGWSLARDIEILLGTLPAVFSGRGAY